MFFFALYRYATPHKISDLHLQVVWRNPTQCEVSHSNYGLQTFLGSSCSNPCNIDHVFCEIWTPLNISAFPQWFQTWRSEIPIVSSFLQKMWWLVRKHPYLNLCKNTVTTTGRGIWRTFSVASSCKMAKKKQDYLQNLSFIYSFPKCPYVSNKKQIKIKNMYLFHISWHYSIPDISETLPGNLPKFNQQSPLKSIPSCCLSGA